MASFDPANFKALQRKEWGEVAAGWQQWWETHESGGQSISNHLVESAGIKSGDRVLDIATGIGEPAVTAARRVGRGGCVVAIDQAPEMLAVAEARATAEGLRNIEFTEMDAEELDLPEESFDVVLCRQGLQYLPSLVPTLGRVRLLLTPGGRLAAATWGEPPKVPYISLAMSVVRQYLRAAPPQPGIPGPFSLSDPNALEKALTNAGFTHVQSNRLTVTFEWSSPEDYTRFIQDIGAPIRALMASESAERQASIWQAVTEAVRPYVAQDGVVRLPAEAICIVGQR
ncbi:MAG TPA: methyltransferase domain-containing protein [Candidatus Binatia bacterium]|nr:methyltransferase domain-containing protein [Candidatus Binatia bacterium]